MIILIYYIMIKTIDDIMYISDNNNPFKHGLLYGKGGLGYKPTPYNMIGGMIGGMAKQNIDTGRIDHELFEKYGVDNMEDLIDHVMRSNLTDKEKYNFLLKEGTDIMIDLKEKADITNNTELKKDVENNTDKIVNLLNDYKKSDYIKTDEQKKLLKLLKKNNIDDNINNHFNTSFEEAKNIKDNFKDQNIERGNIVEDDITKNKLILDIIDDDNTPAYNTKDLHAYNMDFINALIKLERGDPNLVNILDVDKLPQPFKDNLYDKYLQYIPVDIVKGNTIWEIKSFTNKLLQKNGSQDMSETKIKGFENNFWTNVNKSLGDGFSIKSSPYKYDIKYKNIDGNKKIDNIYFKINSPVSYYGKRTKMSFNFDIPIFKQNLGGYNYHWLYDNKDKIGFINPLKKDNFEKLESQLNNPDTKIDSKGKKILKVNNNDIRILPYSYSKTLNDFKKKNKKLVSIEQLENNLYKKTLEVQKK